MIELLTGDWEFGYIDICLPDHRILHVLRKDFLKEELWERFEGYTFAIEKAHLEPFDKSKAQIYTKEELQQLAGTFSKYDIDCRVLGQAKLADRARIETGKTKKEMALAYHVFLTNHPEILECARKFPIVEHPTRKPALEVIKINSNDRLNILRGGNSYEGPELDYVFRIIDDKFDTLSEDFKLFFNVKRPTKQQKLVKNNLYAAEQKGLEYKPLVSVYCVVFDDDNKLRRNKEGQFIGVDTIWRVLGQNANTGKKGGVARSNIMHWWQKKYLKPHIIVEFNDKKEKISETRFPDFYKTRRRMKKVLREAIQLFRDNEPDYQASGLT